MKQEYNYLPTLCRSYLDGGQAVLREDIDYTQLYCVAHSHNLSAAVFCVLNTAQNKDAVPPEAKALFEEDFYEAIIRYNLQSQAQEKLDTVLSGAGIRHVFFKGAVLKEIYPVPQARIMGDIDVLIAAQDRSRVKRLLVSEGVQAVNTNGPVYDYNLDGCKIEMHTKIISGKVGGADAEAGFADAMQHADFDGNTGTLTPDYHFAYLIAHLAHHFWFYGAGVKLILDLAAMLKNGEINTDAVTDKMREIGLLKFYQVIMTVCYEWFGVGKDYGCDTEKTKRFLLSYGAFGNVNRNKAAVIERKELEEGKRTSGVMTRLRLLFPPYRKMKDIPYLKFMEGRPYLVPFAWVYRLVYNLRRRKDLAVHAAKNIGSDETDSSARRELAYFKEIGLI